MNSSHVRPSSANWQKSRLAMLLDMKGYEWIDNTRLPCILRKMAKMMHNAYPYWLIQVRIPISVRAMRLSSFIDIPK